MDSVLIGLYGVAALGLGLFGLHRFFLLYLLWRHGAGDPDPPADAPLPVVTVQLPIFNEPHVVRRLLRSVGRLRYPRDRLEIQVLDDSTDETPRIVAREVRDLAERGIHIRHIRRESRRWYKAGALAHGLASARGELICVFDADFCPEPDTLLRMVPHFADRRVGMVQARWGHLNASYSLLTRVQALLLDGHFLVEHAARFASGRFFNFNGTAGMWRRSCIEDAGGWSGDTLTEDLDLSYRAQLRGWKFVFLRDLVVPGELPVEMSAYKKQQHRWAKGSVQTARKLLPLILRSRLPWRQKVEAVFHLTGNLTYLLMVVPSVLALPLLPLRWNESWANGAALFAVSFGFATLSVFVFYGKVARESGMVRIPWGRIVGLMAVGVGMSLNNARAVMEALTGHRSPFVRTPKYSVRHTGDGWRRKRYAGSRDRFGWMELLFGIYFGVAVVWAGTAGRALAIPFLAIWQFGFVYVGSLSLMPALCARRHSAKNIARGGT